MEQTEEQPDDATYCREEAGILTDQQTSQWHANLQTEDTAAAAAKADQSTSSPSRIHSYLWRVIEGGDHPVRVPIPPAPERDRGI